MAILGRSFPIRPHYNTLSDVLYSSLRVSVFDEVKIIEGPAVSGTIALDSMTDTIGVPRAFTATNKWWGQGFTASFTDTLATASFYIIKGVGAPTGPMYIEIYAATGLFTSTGTPTGAPLATSNSIDASTTTAGYVSTLFTFSGANKITLTRNTNYYVVLKHTTGDASNQIYGGASNNTGTALGHSVYSTDGTAWNALTNGYDMSFSVNGDLGIPKLDVKVSLSVFDQITVTDVAAFPSALSINVSDTITITESLSPNKIVTSISLSDTVAVFEGPNMSTTESTVDTFSGGVTGAIWFDASKYFGQTFQVSGEVVLTSTIFPLSRAGAPTGNAVVQIYAHTGTYGVDGKPTGSALATSDNIDVTTIPVSTTNTTFTFSGANKITLSANTKYVAVVFYALGTTISPTIYIIRSNSAAGYGNSVTSTNGTVWSVYSSSGFFDFTVKGNASIPKIIENVTVSVSETVTITENVSFVVSSNNLLINVSDLITISDVYLVPNINTNLSTSDNITISESVTLITNVTISVFDQITITENIQIGSGIAIITFEQITISDVYLTAKINTNLSTADNITISESATLITNINILVSDTLTITETAQSGIIVAINITDIVNLSENVQMFLPSLSISVSDLITITEQFYILNGIYEAPMETITISENIAFVINTRASISDTITIADVPVLTLTSRISASDLLTVSENVSISITTLFVSVSDQLTITENTQQKTLYEKSLFDSISISENVSLVINTRISVNDTISVSENLVIGIFINVLVSDSVSIGELFGSSIDTYGYDIPEYRPQGSLGSPTFFGSVDMESMYYGSTENSQSYEGVGGSGY